MEIRKLNTEIEQFNYITSHEMKGSVRTLSTLTSWLLQDDETNLGAEGHRNLNLIVDRVRKMHDLIEAFLEYSHLGRNGEEKQWVSLDRIVKNVLAILIVPREIKVTIKKPLPRINFNPAMLSVVFANLVSNAIKYNDKQEGRIEISAVPVEDVYEFQIKDNGVGIEARYFKKVFQLFESLNPAEGYTGTGLGLAIVKKILELNGGHIWLESTVGEGSTFYFTLPKG